MQKLNYSTLENIGYNGYLLKDAPERVLQFGEGNFLRAFIDYYVDVLNEEADFNGKVVIIQPRKPHSSSGVKDSINEQEGLYTLYSRGFEHNEKVNDKRVISSVSRCLNSHSDYESFMACADNPDLRFITSNTTEAGIVYDPQCNFTDTPATSFPGKLTQFLYRRFEIFGSEKGKGFVILPCELIDDNGNALKECVLKYADQWNLGEEFTKWIEEENLFCSTLVDRIVTGYPQNEAEALNAENGYEDAILNTAEVFSSWVIEGPQSLKEELPFDKTELPILITDDHKPYKQRKVRILNGAHTSMVLGAYLAGQDIVRDCMDDEVILNFMNKTIYDEIIPTLSLCEEDCKGFAAAVTERFKNPFIDHSLLAISLNSTSKWKARVLPSLKGYVEQFASLPACITASFAFYLKFYKGLRLEHNGLTASRGMNEYMVGDEHDILEFYAAHKDDSLADYVHAACSNTGFWDEDLTLIPGFEAQVLAYLKAIGEKGVYEVMKACL